MGLHLFREYNTCHNRHDGRFCSRTRPGTPLPDDPRRYFQMETPGIELIPLARVRTIRARPDGIAKAEKYMAAAARGDGSKRKPLDARRNKDGSYTILDGNSTTAIARKHFWRALPVIVREEE